MATVRAVRPVTIIAGTGGLSLGVRASLNASGTCDAQDATKRGDYIAAETILPGKTGCAYRMTDGEVIALASVAVADGDPAYTAAAGGFTNVATNATYVGKWREAVAANALGSLLLESAA